MSRRVRLVEFARARSGDKGDVVDISLFAPDAEHYALICREASAERVRQHFALLVRGGVERFEVPNLRALKFVLHGALDGGASRSLRSDSLGKCFGAMLLRMEVEAGNRDE